MTFRFCVCVLLVTIRPPPLPVIELLVAGQLTTTMTMTTMTGGSALCRCIYTVRRFIFTMYFPRTNITRKYIKKKKNTKSQKQNIR